MSTREPQINTKDVVLEVLRKVDKLTEDMADVKVIAATVGTTVEALHDHEMRIRTLESKGSEQVGATTEKGDSTEARRWWLTAAVAVIAAVSWIPDFLHRLHHG